MYWNGSGGEGEGDRYQLAASQQVTYCRPFQRTNGRMNVSGRTEYT